jgi:signal transduction histidine kinase
MEKIYTFEPLKKYLKVMKQNCYRLLRLINNLIDMNRIEVGFYKLDFKNYDVVKIIEDISLSVAEYTKTKGIELIFDTEVEEKFIACDAEKLERIMLNLLSNAIKFTSYGGTISVYSYDSGNERIIAVKDSGIGIDGEKVKTLFSEVNISSSTGTAGEKGAGLGLLICKEFISRNGGRIWVDSIPGEGSTFYFSILSAEKLR